MTVHLTGEDLCAGELLSAAQDFRTCVQAAGADSRHGVGMTAACADAF